MDSIDVENPAYDGSDRGDSGDSCDLAITEIEQALAVIELTGNETAAEIHARRGSTPDILFRVKRSTLVRCLERFAAGELSNDEIVRIADALEANEYVEYEEGHESVIADVLFKLATPVINGELMRAEVADLVKRLGHD